MSVQAIDWALRLVKNITPTQKLILICLANHAGPDGTCWPSQSTIADYSCLSRESIYRNLSELENHGFIQSIRRKDTVGRDLPKSYRLLLCQPSEPSSETKHLSQQNHQTPEIVANSLGETQDLTRGSNLQGWGDAESHLTKSTLYQRSDPKMANLLGETHDLTSETQNLTGETQDLTNRQKELKTKKTKTTTSSSSSSLEPASSESRTGEVVVSEIDVGKPGESKLPQAKESERTTASSEGVGDGLNLLLQAGVSSKRAEVLARKNGGERIRAVVEYAQSRRPDNPPAFIALALEEGWRIPADGGGPTNEPDQKSDLYRRDLKKWNALPYGERSRLLRRWGWGGNSNYPLPSWLRETLARIETGKAIATGEVRPGSFGGKTREQESLEVVTAKAALSRKSAQEDQR